VVTARPYMSISVQIDTPDAPPLDGRPVRLVSWSAIRYDRGDVSYVIYAHHKDQAKDKEPLTEILRAEVIDPAIVPDWVPWPPAGWLASLELPSLRSNPVANALAAATIARVNGGRRQF